MASPPPYSHGEFTPELRADALARAIAWMSDYDTGFYRNRIDQVAARYRRELCGTAEWDEGTQIHFVDGYIGAWRIIDADETPHKRRCALLRTICWMSLTLAVGYRHLIQPYLLTVLLTPPELQAIADSTDQLIHDVARTEARFDLDASSISMTATLLDHVNLVRERLDLEQARVFVESGALADLSLFTLPVLAQFEIAPFITTTHALSSVLQFGGDGGSSPSTSPATAMDTDTST